MIKKLQRAFVTAFLVTLYTLVQAQENEALQITVAPLAIIDPLTGTFQVGIQQRLNYRLAVSIDYGLRFTLLSYYSYYTERKNYKYSKSRVQIKYYIRRPGSNANKDQTPYLALQALFFPQTYSKKDNYLLRDNGYLRYELSDIKRTIFQGCFLGGYEINQRKIIYDIYAGIGVKNINIKHQLHGSVQSMNPPFLNEIFRYSLDRREGTFNRLNLACGFKIGYILNK